MRTRRAWIAWVLFSLSLAAAPAAAETQVQYMAIFMAGKKVGYARNTRAVRGGKVVSSSAMQITIGRAGIPLTIIVSERNVETTKGKPLSFAAVVLTQNVQGTVANGKVTATTTTAGKKPVKQTFPWPAGAVMNEGARLLAIRKGLAEKTRYSLKVFSPSMLSAMPATVVVGPKKEIDLLGRVVRLTEVTTVTQGKTGKITTTAYVDKATEAKKTITPILGMTMELIECSRAFALSPNDVVDFFKKLLLQSPQPLEKVSTAKAITYKLAAVGTKSVKIPATDNQKVAPGAGGKVTVTVRPVAAAAGAPLPYMGTNKAALAALKPTRYLQSDDAAVARLAREAVGDTKDAAEAVRRIETFVRGYIRRKDLSVGYATASEVAASKQGDCTEHAVLAAAMCRAVGIPAQVVNGVAYVRELVGQKHVFGPHAWARARVGDKWVGLDAALSGYDAGHIALSVGDGNPTHFFDLVNTLGYFRIVGVTVEK